MRKIKSKRKLASVLLVMLSIIMLVTACGKADGGKDKPDAGEDRKSVV